MKQICVLPFMHTFRQDVRQLRMTFKIKFTQEYYLAYGNKPQFDYKKLWSGFQAIA